MVPPGDQRPPMISTGCGVVPPDRSTSTIGWEAAGSSWGSRRRAGVRRPALAPLPPPALQAARWGALEDVCGVTQTS